MGDVFPNRNLPGPAEQWGRSVEHRIVSGEDFDVQLSQKVDNGQRATSGQLAVMADQLEALAAAQTDLLGRESYAVFWQGNRMINSNVVTSPLVGLDLSVTLNEPRVVRVQTTIQLDVFAGSASFPSVGATVGINLNGSVLPPDEFNSASVQTNVSGMLLRSQLTSVSLFSRPAGSYEVAPWVSTSVTSGGNVIISSGSTVIDVLQRV